MICNFIFYLCDWGSDNIIHRMHGSNMCPANVGEVVIFTYRDVGRHFVVKERIIDYNNHTIHYKVESACEVNLEG